MDDIQLVTRGLGYGDRQRSRHEDIIPDDRQAPSANRRKASVAVRGCGVGSAAVNGFR
jgi:hypothetical protein